MTESRVILVTGSSRGIGAGLVAGFARKGCRAAINYAKSEEEANRLYGEIVGFTDSDEVPLVRTDVSVRADVRDMFDRVVANFGCNLFGKGFRTALK